MVGVTDLGKLKFILLKSLTPHLQNPAVDQAPNRSLFKHAFPNFPNEGGRNLEGLTMSGCENVDSSNNIIDPSQCKNESDVPILIGPPCWRLAFLNVRELCNRRMSWTYESRMRTM